MATSKIALLLLCALLVSADAASTIKYREVKIYPELHRTQSFAHIYLSNYDTLTSERYANIIYKAFNFNNADALSRAVRVLIGFEEGDLMDSMSVFVRDVSPQLVVQPYITSTLRAVLSGKIGTERGISVLSNGCDKPQHPVSKVNSMYFVMAALMNMQTSMMDDGQTVLFQKLQNSMPDNSDTMFVLQCTTFTWQWFNERPINFASDDFFKQVSTKSVHPDFGSKVRVDSSIRECKDIREPDHSDHSGSSGSKECKDSGSKHHSKESKDSC